ncbi:hypothetical protein GP486_002363 [Trichoglossum hirsutum]|uniref:YCII-related domain-containing protein n=1 Tax=Trichoglossum hirsutum TaxID=265104 RepID=A0A9P8LF84_9PEZI|nr:hypothetical protein GP486_002363 [Trichoglossum hirsutum]
MCSPGDGMKRPLLPTEDRQARQADENQPTDEMLFAIFVRANADSEAGQLADTALLTAMSNYNQSLVDAGVLITGEGLTPSSQGARVTFSGDPSDPATVAQGPFPPEELVCGFWLWDLKNKEEAIEWVKKCPMGKGAVIEIRPGIKPEDFGEALTEELQKKEAEMRKSSKLAKKEG